MKLFALAFVPGLDHLADLFLCLGDKFAAELLEINRHRHLLLTYKQDAKLAIRSSESAAFSYRLTLQAVCGHVCAHQSYNVGNVPDWIHLCSKKRETMLADRVAKTARQDD